MAAPRPTPAADPQCQGWQRMVSILEAERDALIANDGERVAAFAAQKVELAQSLVPSSLSLSGQTAALARLAKDLNQANAALLQQRLAQTQQALTLLRPRKSVGAAEVYGPDGRTAQRSGSSGGFSVA